MSDRVPPFERFGETLLAPSLIRLFGRVFTGLTIEREIAADAARQSYPANQLSQILNDENSRLARIYGFSFEGNYFKMAAPAVFVVNGPGIDVTPGQDPIALSIMGVEFKDEVFASEVKMWGYGQARSGNPDRHLHRLAGGYPAQDRARRGHQRHRWRSFRPVRHGRPFRYGGDGPTWWGVPTWWAAVEPGNLTHWSSTHRSWSYGRSVLGVKPAITPRIKLLFSAL